MYCSYFSVCPLTANQLIALLVFHSHLQQYECRNIGDDLNLAVWQILVGDVMDV